jgi:hypothetical protein
VFRNIAGQVIGVQMLGTDGSASTAVPNVYVSKDGGALGTGSGTCTHLGTGYHKYVPSAGDTDGDHVAFQFVGAAGIVPATIQVYTFDKVASDALNASAKTIGIGTCTSGGSGTSVPVSSINFAGSTAVGTNVLAGRRIYFPGTTTSTAIRDAGARITANGAGATPTLTLSTSDQLQSAPANGDIFVVL